jgi:hypothetical protein
MYKADKKIIAQYRRDIQEYIINNDNIELEVLSDYKNHYKRRLKLNYGEVVGFVILSLIPALNTIVALLIIIVSISKLFGFLSETPIVKI